MSNDSLPSRELSGLFGAPAEIEEHVAQAGAFVQRLRDEVGTVIVGQQRMVDRILIALLARGHVLLQGVPGVAKTLTVHSVANTLRCHFSRIQFTPDLLPADVVGTMIYDQRSQTFTPKQGPVFANLVLADEINRAPAKVQSALLEAMQERQVTLGDATYPLPEPFVVLATQNPIEQEGTYPLPEAQLDRFMLMVKVGYPTREEELAIMNRMTGGSTPRVAPVASPEALLAARKVVDAIYVDDRIKKYIVDLVFATREPAALGLREIGSYIAYGASPRASINLVLAARAHAFLRRRSFVTPEDVKSIAPDVLRHRLVRTYEAEAEEVTADEIIRRIFERVRVP